MKNVVVNFSIFSFAYLCKIPHSYISDFIEYYHSISIYYIYNPLYEYIYFIFCKTNLINVYGFYKSKHCIHCNSWSRF